MIDHVCIYVSNYTRAKSFYARALAPLGYALVLEFDGTAGYGTAGKPDFWIAARTHTAPEHVAFTAVNRTIVDQFHAAALAAGGTENGEPAVRPHYHKYYYGAFIRDPDGHNIEAVCHDPNG